MGWDYFLQGEDNPGFRGYRTPSEGKEGPGGSPPENVQNMVEVWEYFET